MTADVVASATQKRFLNRQLSWLEFNRRVLALAEDLTLPVADRMRFVSIWARNLDEYYLVRMAALKTILVPVGRVASTTATARSRSSRRSSKKSAGNTPRLRRLPNSFAPR